MLAMTLGEFQVYVVEVCRGCGWNHLVSNMCWVVMVCRSPPISPARPGPVG